METDPEKKPSADASSDASSIRDAEVIDDFPKTPEAISKEKERIYKNIFLISVAFLFNFNAYGGLSRLQSSLHRDEGMGVINQAVLYGALVISCMFIPKLIIGQIGHKWTIAISFSGYILWMAANGYAVWGTMVTTSILVGLCAGPLWTAQCAYFTKLSSRWSQMTGESEAVVVSRFFGYFFMFFQLSAITGSIISATILQPDQGNGTEELSAEEVTLYCGINDCPWNNVSNPNTVSPDSKTVWTMLGIYIGIACLAVVTVSVFVDRLPRSLRDKKTVTRKELGDQALNTFKHMRNPAQLILIPMTMYSGLEQGFYGAEFTNSFITCGLGIWKVGLVTLPFGVVNALVSLTSGQLIKHTGRVPVFITGLLVDLAIQITMYTWPLDKDKEYVLYILAGLWGITDGIWQTQINSLYGSVFVKNSEAAFSNYRLWESLGFILAFGYSNFLCTEDKLIILTCFLGVGIIGYFTVEGMERKKKKLQKKLDDLTKKELHMPETSKDDKLEPVTKATPPPAYNGYTNVAFTRSDENVDNTRL